ncbi:MAG: DUF2268 domain-containing putative Zn-dependent protease [Bacteroidia bacterium]|nr:DUF2268 domain-containing putative Zn-dependent protease [Bacteroidia bacterium]
MKYWIVILLLLPAFVFAQGEKDSWKDAKLIFSDMDNFWKAYEQDYPGLSRKTLKQIYLSPASADLQQVYIPFIVGKRGKVLTRLVNTYPDYFEGLKKLDFRSEEIVGEIRKGYRGLKEIYPAAQFADVYFAVGTFSSAGAFMNGKLAISVEMFPAKSQVIDNTNTVNFAALPAVVIHEMVHYQQKRIDDKTLLAASIREGSADFITEMVMDKNMNQHIHDFANPKEAELWQEFRSDMNANNYHNWLYTQEKGRMKDLGYWMGYKIVEAYYKKYKGEPDVISRILNIDDYASFLKSSGYNPGSP